MKYETTNLVYELVCHLLIGECFYGGFTSNGGNDSSDILQLQEAVDGQQYFVKAVLLLPQDVVDSLDFWDRGENVVFPEVNCLGDHAQGGQCV